ncbi:MAG: pirin family protein, partial [Pseudanabaena sp.]
EDGAEVTHSVNPNRYAWIQVARGNVLVSDRLLHDGDAISSDQAGDLKIISQGNAEILVFDLA